MKIKTSNLMIIILISIILIFVVGCGKNTSTNKENENTNVKTDEAENSTEENKIDNIILLDNDQIKSVLSETTSNADLEKAIVDELELSESQAKETNYYYNYVDLNNDNKNEIIVEVVEPTVSKNTILIFNEKLEEMNDFDNAKNPIIISDDISNGWKNIILDISISDNNKEYAVLKYDGIKYNSIDEAEIIKEINNISGTAIIANDMSKENINNIALYLKKS